MFYKGIPLVEKNTLEEALIQDSLAYFKLKAEHVQFAEKIFERYLQGKVDLVVYNSATWNDEILVEYHKRHYGDTPYYVQELLSDRTVKTTIIKDFKIAFYSVTHYSEGWDEKKEHSYDDKFNLIEYREFVYDGSVIKGEKIFFASNWLISEESFG
jgi:hypothetical protein